MRGLFVTGTDTAVGKTAVSACLLAAMRAAGEPVRAYKPVITGLEEPSPADCAQPWPPDHELLGALVGMRPEEVSSMRYGPAVAPHLAAQLAGRRIDVASLIATAQRLADGHTLIVEGVGGLLVPLSMDFSVCDLARALGFGVIVVARSGLGTINHTLLTLAAARAGGLEVRAVVMNRWPARPSPLERSNRETLEGLGRVEVATLGVLGAPHPDELVRAAARLPWEHWLA
jgi:dethiobiotin synthetase